jgi:uncharacterized membrane protein (GlpM family)
MSLIIFKIIVSFLLALALTWLAERKSLYWAGILSSFPNVSLFTMLFLALEQGVDFTTKSSLYGVYGVVGNIILVSVIMFVSFYTKSVWIPFLLGILTFISLSFFAVVLFPTNVYLSIIIAAIVWLIFLFIWRNLAEVKVHKPIESKVYMFLLQFAIISFFILFATYVAPFVGEAWAGIIGAYASLTTSIGLIIMIKYGSEELRTFFKSAILGWLPTAIYLFTLTFSYERFGLLWGTLASLGVAGVVVVGLHSLKKVEKIRLI